MGSRATHHLDEVPILASGVAVALDVTDELGVSLTSGVETERGLNLVVLQVAVDGLRAADDLHTVLLSSIVLSKHAGVGVGVVATDDDNSLDVELANDLQTLLELLHLLELRTAGANHVEATRVAILVGYLLRDLHVVVVDQTARTEDEAVETVLGIEFLDGIEETRDDVMTARSLTTAEDHADVHHLRVGFLAGHELHQRHTVGVGEQLLDFFLIAYTLCGFTFLYLNSSLQAFRQFGQISCAFNLQKTFFHCYK